MNTLWYYNCCFLFKLYVFSHYSEKPETLSEELGLEGEKPSSEEQLKLKWESLNHEFNNKQRLLQKALEQEQLVAIFNFSMCFLCQRSYHNTNYSMCIANELS